MYHTREAKSSEAKSRGIMNIHTAAQHYARLLDANVLLMRDKVPQGKWGRWQHERQTDRDITQQFSNAQPGDKIGVIVRRGLVVLDIDAERDGDGRKVAVDVGVLHTLLAALELPQQYEWAGRSSSGTGWHIWLSCEDSPTDGHTLACAGTGDGVREVEVLYAPQRIATLPRTTGYGGVAPDEPPASVPWAAVLQAVQAVAALPAPREPWVPRAAVATPANPERGARYAQAALDGMCRDIQAAAPGKGNDALYQAGCRAATFANAGWAAWEHAHDLLLDAWMQRKDGGARERNAAHEGRKTLLSARMKAGNDLPPELPERDPPPTTTRRVRVPHTVDIVDDVPSPWDVEPPPRTWAAPTVQAARVADEPAAAEVVPVEDEQGGSSEPAPEAERPARARTFEARSPRELPTLAKVIEACDALYPPLWYNEVKARPYMGNEPLTDNMLVQMLNEINDTTGTPLAKITRAVQQECAANSRNPIIEYLDRVADAYDGSDQLGELARHIHAEEGQEWVYICIRKWGIGHVARQYEHGKANAVLLLAGAQGTGKSGLVRWLCPPELREDYFKEHQLSDSDEEAVVISDFFLLELSEIDSTTRKSDAARLKAMITQEKTDYRRKYARHITTAPARAGMIGTTNALSGYLTDASGFRRFLPLTITGIDWRAYTASVDIDMLWGQLVTLYRAGHRGTLTPQQAAVRDAIASNYLVDSVMGGWIAQLFEAAPDDTRVWTSADVVDALIAAEKRASADKSTTVDIARAMRQLFGIESRPHRAGGRVVRGYRGIALREGVASRAGGTGAINYDGTDWGETF